MTLASSEVCACLPSYETGPAAIYLTMLIHADSQVFQIARALCQNSFVSFSRRLSDPQSCWTQVPGGSADQHCTTALAPFQACTHTGKHGDEDRRRRMPRVQGCFAAPSAPSGDCTIAWLV